jgi:tetratricopeptide (TPR) repeat protein
MVTWAGMIGCVSGINDQGMTLTINASKSDYPTAAKTPISILSREILQYAKNIDEAFAIAKKRETFVSESIMIGSWLDRQTAIIEKSPTKCALLRSKENQIICANHYQSDSFIHDASNIENVAKSTSNYRYKTVEKALQAYDRLTVQEVATILRKRDGLNAEDLGMGNEKALNQLICHHSVIFKPNELKMWVSAGPYQIGTYVCYDLKKIGSQFKGLKSDQVIYNEAENIAPDSFLQTQAYKNFEQFKTMKYQMRLAIHASNAQFVSPAFEKLYISLNPNYFDTYASLARYYAHFGQKAKAISLFKEALKHEMPSVSEQEAISQTIVKLSKPD